jgi:hypothetical protein
VIHTCDNCGGLYATEDGEMFGGRACQCDHAEANVRALAARSKADILRLTQENEEQRIAGERAEVELKRAVLWAGSLRLCLDRLSQKARAFCDGVEHLRVLKSSEPRVRGYTAEYEALRRALDEPVPQPPTVEYIKDLSDHGLLAEYLDPGPR